MSKEDLLQLQKESMALRNIASRVLEKVERELNRSAPTLPAKKKKAIRHDADLTTRLLTGQRKPKMQ